jgi:hypothetical protein
VGIGVVFARAVVVVLGGGRVRREFFQPDIIIMQQAVLGVIDENGCRGMRCPIAICTSRGCVAPARTIGLLLRPPQPRPKPLVNI